MTSGMAARNSVLSSTSVSTVDDVAPVVIERPVYTQASFDEGFVGGQRHYKTWKERCHQLRETCSCSGPCVKNFLCKVFPFVRIMRSYNPRTDLLSDLVSGVMVGIMNIPQGMAYALLAGVAPAYGLYVSFFPVLLYFFFGTSRHIALGTFAVMSLMVAKVVDSVDCSDPSAPRPVTISPETVDLSALVTDIYNSTSGKTNGEQGWSEYEDNCRIGVAAALTFMAGVMQLGLGILQLGFVSIYLSEPLTRAFTTGAAVHVLTSQVSTVLGLKLQRFTGPGKLVFTYIAIFQNISLTNLTSLVISVICIIILYIVKEFINPLVKAKFRIPIPIELFVVIVSTLVAYFAKFSEQFGLSIVGHIPTGIRPPSMPRTDHISAIAGDAFAVAIVGFAISVAQAKFFAKKLDYQIVDNQELLALGIVNFISSFFNCFVAAASLSRSLVQENSGGKTQVAGLVSCVLVLIVLLVMGPLFQTLPNCALASIIIVALKGMFMQLADLRKLWFISKIDWTVWVVTFLATVLLDVDLGLLVGVGYSLLTVIARTQRPYTCALGQVPQTDIYRDVTVYDAAQEISGIKIFRFEASLYYANGEHFVNKIFAKTGLNPRKLRVARQKQREKWNQQMKKNGINETGEAVVNVDMPTSTVHTIIVDCTTMGYVDCVGVTVLSQVISEYKLVGVSVFLAGCKAGIREMLEVAGFYEKIHKKILYVSIHDAVLAAVQRGNRLEEIQEEEEAVGYCSCFGGHCTMKKEDEHSEVYTQESTVPSRDVSQHTGSSHSVHNGQVLGVTGDLQDDTQLVSHL